MAELISFGVLACVFGFLLGLIRPAWTVFWGKRTRKGAWVYLLGMFVLLGILGAITPPDRQALSTPTTATDVPEPALVVDPDNKAAPKPVVTKEKPRIPLIPTSLIEKRFNQAGQEFGSNLRLRFGERDPGEVNDTVLGYIDKNIGFTCVYQKPESNPFECTLIGAGDGSKASGFRVIMAMGQIFATFSPELHKSQRGKLLEGLVASPDETTIVKQGNIQYTMLRTEHLGIWLSVSSAAQ